MSFQQFQAKLLAVTLFVTSVGGTFAIFGCVPLLARFTSSTPKAAPTQFQAFPEVSSRSDADRPFAAASPSDRSKHARAIYVINSQQAKQAQVKRTHSLD